MNLPPLPVTDWVEGRVKEVSTMANKQLVQDPDGIVYVVSFDALRGRWIYFLLPGQALKARAQ